MAKNIEEVLKQPESDLVVNNILDRYRKGLYSLIMVTGLPGTGKSSVCFRLKELAATKFPNKKITTRTIENLGQLAKFAMEANELEANLGVVEEVSTLFPSRRAMAGTNVDLAKVLDTCRKKKIILFANAPLWPSIDSHMRSMGTIYVETLKIYKGIGIVISKFFRLQTNPGTGKTYTHTMLRSGREVKRMYTRMPNLDDWKEYERKKDEFMKDLYIRIQKREEQRDDKERKTLGMASKIYIPKPLTPNELQVYQIRLNTNKSFDDIGTMLGVSGRRCSAIYANVLKKLQFSKEAISKNSPKSIPTGNKVNLEYSDEKNNNDEEDTIIV